MSQVSEKYLSTSVVYLVGGLYIFLSSCAPFGGTAVKSLHVSDVLYLIFVQVAFFCHEHCAKLELLCWDVYVNPGHQETELLIQMSRK